MINPILQIQSPRIVLYDVLSILNTTFSVPNRHRLLHSSPTSQKKEQQPPRQNPGKSNPHLPHLKISAGVPEISHLRVYTEGWTRRNLSLSLRPLASPLASCTTFSPTALVWHQRSFITWVCFAVLIWWEPLKASGLEEVDCRKLRWESALVCCPRNDFWVRSPRLSNSHLVISYCTQNIIAWLI